MEFTLLSRLDDFLCDTFLDCFYLWFSTIKMSKYHRRPNIQSDRLADIVYRRVICANDLSGAISEIFRIPSVIEFRAKLTEAEEIEFNSHMKRYLCMYLPTAGYEISDTDRYGGVEARVIATKDWRAGDEIRHCTGVITCLDPEQDRMLKAQNRDFSVMWSTRKNTSCLFLGPARFLNHDCESNTKFMPFGENGISFKVIRNIACGEEITTFYGEHYFGENNSECLCVSCEKRGEGAFAKTRNLSGSASISPTANSGHDSQRRSSRRRKIRSFENFFPISGGPRQPRKCKREASPTQSSCSNASADGTGSAANKSREVSSSFLSNAVEWPQEDLYPVSASRCQALQHTDTNLFQILCDVSSQMPYSVPRSYVNVTDSMANPYYYNYYYDNHGPPYYHSYVPRQPPPVYNYPIINPYEQKIPDECATCGSSMVGRLDEWLRNPSSRRGEWPPTRCPRCDRHWLIFRQRWPIRKVRKKYTRRATKTAEQQTQQGQSESEDKQQKLNFDKRREAKIVWSEVFHQPR